MFVWVISSFSMKNPPKSSMCCPAHLKSKYTCRRYLLIFAGQLRKMKVLVRNFSHPHHRLREEPLEQRIEFRHTADKARKSVKG
jgi:hypothetical protein